MIVYEDFLRCPHCDYNQFDEEKIVIINKEAYEKNKSIVLNKKRLTYICNQCGHKLIEVIEEQ